jgi:hypothetical protein
MLMLFVFHTLPQNMTTIELRMSWGLHDGCESDRSFGVTVA